MTQKFYLVSSYNLLTNLVLHLASMSRFDLSKPFKLMNARRSGRASELAIRLLSSVRGKSSSGPELGDPRLGASDDGFLVVDLGDA